MSARIPYSQRASFCQHPLAQQLLLLMDNKKTNLALSADVIYADQLIRLANEIGPEICILKTHIDILTDFTPALTHELITLSRKHAFYIFEDRKFADIGNTVKQQYQGGMYEIANWADFINAHGLPGPGIIQGLADVGLKKQRALLLLAEMSSTDNLIDSVYTQKTLQMAEHYSNFVVGFIAKQKLSAAPQWIYFTPGVQLGDKKVDALGQRYLTPEQVIIEQQSDIIIVGRGIIEANDPLTMAKTYRQAGWEAYLQDCG